MELRQELSDAPVPRIVIGSEPATVHRSDGLGLMFETIDVPVIELSFVYGDHRISASDPEPRFFTASSQGMQPVLRDLGAERRARCLLESFGAVDLECLEDWATAPTSRADYLVRCDGDVHDYCSFSAWVVPQLRELGWQVEIAADYPYRIVSDEPGWYARIEADSARADWFGLHLGVELGGSEVNLLPALLSLLERTRSGTSLATLAERKRRLAVPLPDGRYLTVPPEPIRALLRVLSELYEGDGADPEVLRFAELSSGAIARMNAVFRSDRSPSWRGLRWRGAASPAVLERAEMLEAKQAPVVIANGLQATLRPYQEDGVSWLAHLRARGVGGILADDMGLGKTLQAIAHLAAEKEAGRLTEPALVVCPTSLCENWAREIKKFAPFLSTLVYTGSKRRRLRSRLSEVDVVITSYPLLVRDEQTLSDLDWHLLILDEAHVIKNTRSLSHRVAKKLSARHRLCMTGTPVENHLGELWALFDFLNPGMLGDELGFRRWYRVPIEQHGDDDRLDALRQRVSPFLLRRLKRDVAKELPPKTEVLRPVRLRRLQRELYESIRVSAHKDVRKVIAKKGLSASTVPILDALMKLRQVCCDPRLVAMKAAHGIQQSAKYELLMELVEAQLGRGHRILVFSQFTRMLRLIAHGLDERNIRYMSLTGASKHRQDLVDGFERGDADVFLISLKAGGVGLTLTRADTVIHYDPWWNPAAQDQATDRAYRIGQTQPVVATNLFVQGSVEERMLELQDRKRRLARGILDGGAGSASFSADDIEELFAPLSI